MTTQLRIPVAPTIAYSARTLIDSRKYLLGDFNPVHFCESDADGNPFLSQHNIYAGGVYVGIVFRYSSDLPWLIQARGEINSRVHGEEIEFAIQALIEWRKELDRKDRRLMEDWKK